VAETATEAIRRLEELAAWHRANADHAGSAWVWEVRLRTAEDLERQAAALRARFSKPLGDPQLEPKGPKLAVDNGSLPYLSRDGYNRDTGVPS
jgi:hypothetical protein